MIKCTRPSADENTPTRNYNLRSMRAWREKAWFQGYIYCAAPCATQVAGTCKRETADFFHSTCDRVMARYTAQGVANLVNDSDFDAESDSDVEDPDFPLPTIDSDDKEVLLDTPSTSRSTPISLSRGGIHCIH